jgi:hypothetical protein
VAVVNLKTKKVLTKIVFYGPGRGGKTTSLESIHRNYRDRINAELVSIDTHGDRTLFFDFIPFEIGKVNGYDVKIQLYTVPGQVKYNATRRLVLRGVDGIVFVADAMAVQREKNIISLQNLQENLEIYKNDIFSMPIVMQYNKIDLRDQAIPLTSVEDLNSDLNSQLKAPWFETSALKGINLSEVLKKIISSTLRSLRHVMR